MKPTTVSLFCGAGGESAGKELAFRDLGIDTQDWASHAINHWDLAVATFGAPFLPGLQMASRDLQDAFYILRLAEVARTDVDPLGGIQEAQRIIRAASSKLRPFLPTRRVI